MLKRRTVVSLLLVLAMCLGLPAPALADPIKGFPYAAVDISPIDTRQPLILDSIASVYGGKSTCSVLEAFTEPGDDKTYTKKIIQQYAAIPYTTTSESPAIATVDAGGTVRAVAPGHTRILFSWPQDPAGRSTYIDVYVRDATVKTTSDLRISGYEYNGSNGLKAGQTVQLRVKGNKENEQVTWLSSNNAMVSVDQNGLVTAKATNFEDWVEIYAIVPGVPHVDVGVAYDTLPGSGYEAIQIFVTREGLPDVSACPDGWVYENLWYYPDALYYYVQNGTAQTGWQQINGKLYHFHSTYGFMQTGVVTIDYCPCEFYPTGEIKQGTRFENGKLEYISDKPSPDGWVKYAGGHWLYLRDGAPVTGWLSDKGSRYYFSPYSGMLYTERMFPDGGAYYASDKSGRVVSNQWQYAYSWDAKKSYWYYAGKDGKLLRNTWKQWRGKWYYLGSNAAMQTGWKKVGGKWYSFTGSGRMRTGWFKSNNKWYYLKPSGAMAENEWVKLKGKWYYLKDGGAMATGKQKIGGKTYKFASNGAWKQ